MSETTADDKSRKNQDGFMASYGWTLKIFASATSVLGGLIAFGFFSEAALYEFAGLPRLSADPLYLAEAGVRALLSSIGAIGFEGGLLLLLSLMVMYGSWSLRDRHSSRRLLQTPLLLVVTQLSVLFVTVFVLASLVGVARMGTASGRDAMDTRERVEIANLRNRTDWTPELELERTESLRIAPTRFARVTQVTGEVLRTAFPPWRNKNITNSAPSLGFPLRPTTELRRTARDFYGWLAVAAILLPASVILLRRWRSWCSSRFPYRLSELVHWTLRKPGHQKLPKPETPVLWGEGKVRKLSWEAFFEASRMLFEPVLIVLSFLVVALIPAAHGVLAEEVIGLQPVVVRLKGNAEEICAPGARSLKWSGGSENETGSSLPFWWEDQTSPASVLPTRWSAEAPHRASAPCTCTFSDLEVLRSKVTSYRSAWQNITLTRASDAEYRDVMAAYQRATDELITTALRLRCAEAFRRIRILAPEPGELEAQPVVAGYFIERFGEALARDGLGLYGHLLIPPRGDEKERLTLINQFGRDRWKLQEIPRSSVAEILLLPGEREIVIEETVAAVRTSPVPDRLEELALYPGELTLNRAHELLNSGYLPHNAEGRLVTLLGAHGRASGREASILRKKIVDTLSSIVREGLERASKQDRGAEDGPRIALAGAAATSLASIGGPYSARRLANLLQNLQAETDEIFVRKLERIPTLVTSAGLLASDVRESLRLYPDRGESCSLVSRAYGPEFPDTCQSEEVRVLRTLVSFLRSAARNSSLQGRVRRAACSGLGLSLEPSAQNQAFGLAVQAIRKTDDALALACLAHTPSRVSEPQRVQLRAFARGRRSAQLGEVEEERVPLSPDLRRLALAELHEGGLWGEAELMVNLLKEEDDYDVLRSVGLTLEDVEPNSIIQRLVECITSGSEEEKWRCTLGGALVGQLGSSDGEFVTAVSPLLSTPANDDHLVVAACAVTVHLAARGDRHASRLLEEYGGDCPERLRGVPMSNGQTDFLEYLAPQDDSAGSIDQVDPIESGRAALAQGDIAEFVNAAQQAVVSGRPELLEWLADIAHSSDHGEEFSFTALEHLLLTDRAAWAPLATEAFVDRPAGPMVMLAAQYLEDGEPTSTEARLLACLRRDETTPRRCLLGLALLSSTYAGSEASLLELGRRLREGDITACRPLAEWAYRGNRDARELAEAGCPALLGQLEKGDGRYRWFHHLGALVDVLEEEGLSPQLAVLYRQELEQELRQDD